ncbi:MAG: hypothetical protein PGN33_22390 [Methylobacterium radiotolerans]
MIQQIPRLLERVGDGCQERGHLLGFELTEAARDDGGDHVAQSARHLGIDRPRAFPRAFLRVLPQSQGRTDRGQASRRVSHRAQRVFNRVDSHPRPPK